ncbi:DNA polymerase I [Fundidesulfovibrio putealis]|uniref:DNA polymerase I n=1 Tax=Fundidesulfovibrio putealis TaxID=270496 RepID=UPI0003FA7788|nr:DNA polymerase I [Fundidesulfovibrio putealis]
MPPRDHLPRGSEPLYLIDGSAFIYRGFYAFSDLTRSDGFPTNALYSVLRLGLRLLREERPRYAAFVMDGRGPSFRADIFPAYKAQREKMPEPLAQQMDPIVAGMKLLGFPVLREEGVEADDTIATLAARCKAVGPVVIIGADKDLRQCLDEQVLLWDPSGKQEKLTTLRDFQADFPPGPAFWPDFQALTGDSSDNIPGVPGVGPKTAIEIVAQFPSLEELREGVALLKPAWRKKIEPHLEDVFVYRELTRLKLDAAVDVSLESLAVAPAPREELVDFLNAYELRSLLRELPREGAPGGQNGSPRPDQPNQPGRASLFDAAPEGGASKGAGVSGSSPQSAPSASPAPSDGGQLSLFGYTAVPQPAPQAAPVQATPLAELPSFNDRNTALVPTDDGFLLAVSGQQWLVAATPAELAPLLAGAASVAAPSLKDLLTASLEWERVPLEKWFDLSLGAYLLSPEERVYSWGRLLDSLWSDPGFSPEEAPDGAQGLACLALARRFAARLEQAGLTPLLRTLELPLVPVLVHMERAGIGIDKAAFAAFAEEVNTRLSELTERMYQQAGMRFNVRSSQQLGDVLYNKLGLKAPGKTPGGAASTSAEVLERLAGQHPLLDSILEYRKLEKLRSTYLEPLPGLADENGRVHTTFNQLTTATGRLSSSAPNLQNIPARGDLGRRMRGLFTAAPGMLLTSADYSQIELRVLAHFSGDPTLMEAFRLGQDIHGRTAALLFDKPQGDVTSEERRQAKTINFGLLYGMGPQKLGRELGLTLNEAKDFIAKYFERLSRLKEYYQSLVEQARENGFVTTLAGRRRLLPDIRSRNTQLEAQARRQAVNTVIQGSAADIIKMAMLAVARDETLKNLNARLILQIHDELVLEAPEASAREAGDRLASLMTGVVELSVPLVADVGVGRDWGLAH